MNTRTHKMILTSLFTALTAIGGFYKIQLPPVPFTLQLFFVIFAGLLLGSRLGFLSQALYIAIGLAGIPVFAAGGGPAYIFKPSFGYLIGFAAAAFVVGKISESKVFGTPGFAKYMAASSAGLLACYAIGVPYMYIVLKYVSNTPMDFIKVLWVGFAVFIPWDLIKIGLASWMSLEIYKRIRSLSAPVKIR